METPAHSQKIELVILEYFPAHEPREDDPHYTFFEAARNKLKAAGKLVCWICGKDEAAAGQPIELHHSTVEFALANGVDLTAFGSKFPDFCHLYETEEEFLEWVESEGNLLPLCVSHHRGKEGIHSVLYSPWLAQSFWKTGLELPAVASSVSGGTING